MFATSCAGAVRKFVVLFSLGCISLLCWYQWTHEQEHFAKGALTITKKVATTKKHTVANAKIVDTMTTPRSNNTGNSNSDPVGEDERTKDATNHGDMKHRQHDNSSSLPPFPWQWIHPQKTGTSFGNALYMLACPEDFSENWTQTQLNMHSMHASEGLRGASQACRKKWITGDTSYRRRPKWWFGEHGSRSPSLSDNQLFITIREPMDRAISHFMHLHKLKDQDTSGISETEIADKIVKGRWTDLQTSLFYPPKTTRLGERAGEACQVIRNAAWVGLTGDFARSVCLLHARFDFPHHPTESVNMRPGKWSSINKTRVDALVRQRTGVPDGIVYKCARERFQSDLEMYAPQCR